jgi:hypothetical protein
VPGAAAVIRGALAAGDDYQARAAMANGADGIYRFGPAMSSMILAACQPARFTVADSRALKTLRRLGLMPSSDGRGAAEYTDHGMTMQLCNARSSADSNAGVPASVAGSLGSVGGEFDDEVGVEGGADPF